MSNEFLLLQAELVSMLNKSFIKNCHKLFHVNIKFLCIYY